MTDIAVFLLPEGNAGSSLRSKNFDNEDFRRVLLNHGNHGESLIARATIVEVATGSLTSEGDPATLLVIEFRFVSLNNSRRFTAARITLKFSDAKSRTNLDPEVYRIHPEDVTLLDKITISKDTEQSLSGSINGGIPVAGGSVGYTWKVTQLKDHEHSARLTGVKYNLRESLSGDDNAAIWSLEEHTSKKNGIPNFLRTAVILRRKADDPFRVELSVETDVNLRSKLSTMFGSAKTEPIDPVNIDPDLAKVHSLDLQEDAAEAEGEKVNGENPNTSVPILKNMSKLKLGDYAGVEFATLIQSN